MRLRRLVLAVLMPLLCWAATAQAETVHLNSGESIRGRIVRVEGDTLYLESERGFGIIQLQRKDVTLIEFDEATRDLTRQFGVGYYHRATPSSIGASAAEYGADALSLKMWLTPVDSVDLQIGFYNADAVLEIFSLDVRYARVFRRRASLDLYYGGSVGVLSVTDNTSGRAVDGTGWSLRGFVGAEIFFPTLPNVGIASEISLGTQDVGGASTTNLSMTTFPSFSLRYYF